MSFLATMALSAFRTGGHLSHIPVRKAVLFEEESANGRSEWRNMAEMDVKQLEMDVKWVNMNVKSVKPPLNHHGSGSFKLDLPRPSSGAHNRPSGIRTDSLTIWARKCPGSARFDVQRRRLRVPARHIGPVTCWKRWRFDPGLSGE